MANKLVIERREASIFVKSTNSKDFPEIVGILSERKKYPHLTKKEYNNLSKENKEFIDRRFGQLFILSAKEWELVKISEENFNNQLECQLCGTKRLRWISKIKNRKTHEMLIVGSECIKNYKEFRGSNGESFQDMELQNNIFRNERVLEEKSPGIIQDTDRFLNIKKERKLIPDYLIRKYDSLKKEVFNYKKQLHTKALNESKIKKFVCVHENVKGFLGEFDEYLSNSSIFSLTDDIANWLISQPNYDYELIRQLQIDGEVTEKTIDFIEEPKFMKGIIPLFDRLFQKDDIIRLNNFRNTTFAIVVKSRPDIVLNVKMAPFIKKYKDYLFHDKLVSIDLNFLNKNCVIDDRKSMQKSLDYIITTDFKRLYKLKDVNYKDNEIAFKNIKNKKIYVADYKKFINDFKEIIFVKEKEQHSINLFNYIKDQTIEYTIDEFNKHNKNLQGAKQAKKN